MPSREIKHINVTCWSPGLKASWTVGEVRSALRAHADGDLSQSSMLIGAMGEDDAIPGLLEKRVGGVLGSDFTLEPVEAPNHQLSKRLAEKYGPAWWDIFPESELHDFLSWRRMLGVGIGVLDWDRGGQEWKARFRCLDPQFLRRDQFNGKWIYNAREGQLEVTPGDGTWILLTDGQRGWMRAAVRALAVAWIAKQLTIRDWNRYNERHGLPIIKAYAPAIADDADKDQFWDDIQAIHSETVAQLPSHLDEHGAKFDLELLEAKDNSFQSFENHLDRCDRRFTIHLLGANMGTEVNKEGARATADTHKGVEREKAEVDAKNLATEIRRQGLFPVIGFNTPSVAIDVIPWPKWDTSPPEDDEAEAQAKKTFGEALGEIAKAGYEVENLEELSERYGLKLKKKEPPISPVALPPAGSVPPANDAEDDDDEQAAARAHEGPVVASGILAAEATGFVQGQEYADRLVTRATLGIRPAIDETVDAIREELEAATGYDDLRDRLRRRYEDMDPDQFSDIVRAYSILAELAGRTAVNQDA